MRRRRLVLLVSAITLGVLGILTTVSILVLTRSGTGRGWIRDVAQSFLSSRIQGGKVYIGRVSGVSLTEIRVDSFAIRDLNGELFVSTGRVTLSIDPRDLADYRIFVRRARVEHPYIHIVQHEDETWNYKRILASKNPSPPEPKDAKRRGLGDYFVIDSTWVKDATFLLTMPWHPDTALHGAARDSTIRAHLENSQKAVARRADGYGRTYAWRNAHGLLRHARLADPDSTAYGRQFVFDTLSVDEYEPTFQFRNVSGDVKHLGDSIWFKVPHFNLPASRGSGTGKVWWGSDKPVRYDIAIRGDSVALDDVNWVYPQLPRTGGGTLDSLLIKNDPKNLKIVDFHLRKMDVRSEKSHLTGNMSFGIGAPVLLVRNVDLVADPVDFDLIRTLNGKPFPYDWRGQLLGTVHGRGGPLTNFVIDDVRGSFRDAHVAGAVSRFTGQGELDILYPALTAFHGFRVDAQALDLRTIEFLNPNFPRIGGIVSGTATLDSSWLDVRFSDANLTHQDGPGEPSRVTGNGRITYGDKFMNYDVTLEAQPLSLTMLARSYPSLPVRGLVSGPIRVIGESPDLEVKTSLQGKHGSLSFDGRLDIDSIGGYAVRGQGSFSSLDVAGLLEKPTMRLGALSGRYDADASWLTPATLRGFANLDIDPTIVDSIRVNRTRARVQFAEGRVKIVDSLRIQTYAGTLVARGGFGLPNGSPDSLHVSVEVDSLGGLRRYLASAADTTIIGTAAQAPDSLSGSASFTGVFAGTMDSFRLSGRASGSDLYVNKDRGDSLSLGVELRDLPHAAKGIVDARISRVTLLGIELDTIGAKLTLTDPEHAQFLAGALSHNGPHAAAKGTWAKAGADNIVVVDSLGLAIDESRWRLASPTRVSLDSSGGVRLDSLLFRNRDSAFVAIAASVPNAGPAFARVRASNIPLRDLGILAQVPDSVRGYADATVAVAGTKASPQIDARADASSVVWRGLDVDRATSTARYRSGRADVHADLARRGTTIDATASLPANVSLFSFAPGRESLSGTIKSDSANLEIVKALFPALTQAKIAGRVTGKMDIGGTWSAPVLSGNVSIADGSVLVPQLGTTFSSINGTVRGTRSAGGDSITVDIGATTDGRPTGRVAIQGFVKNLLQSKNNQEFSLALGANNLHVFNKRSLADVYITTPTFLDSIRLRGTTQASTLTGNLKVDHSSIYLPDRDIARKQAVGIYDDSVATTETLRGPTFGTLMMNLRPNVTISLGDDVRLRSAEANVRLTGSLRLLTSTDRSRTVLASNGLPIPKFNLEGTLNTAGGTYNMNLNLVQREFTVLNGGTVLFDGDAKNPLLDIRAQYNVRRPGDRDLGVIVNLSGRLLQPGIEFTSDADYTIAQSDLISYLLIGRAGFDYGANQQATQALASFLAPTLSAVAADKLRQTPLGSFVDAFQFQLGTSTAANNSNNLDALSGYFYGATIAAEKQYKSVFLNLNTGLCQLQTQTFDPRNNVGAKMEYRVKPQLALKLAYDPPTAGRICNQANIIGLIPTPPQWSLSFSHTWRF